jgi:hypothetical protein
MLHYNWTKKHGAGHSLPRDFANLVMNRMSNLDQQGKTFHIHPNLKYMRFGSSPYSTGNKALIQR